MQKLLLKFCALQKCAIKSGRYNVILRYPLLYSKNLPKFKIFPATTQRPGKKRSQLLSRKYKGRKPRLRPEAAAAATV